MRYLILILSITSIIQISIAQELSIDQIMRGQEFVGHLPENIYWSENNQNIYFNWNPENELLSSQYITDINGSEPRKLSIEELRNLEGRGGSYNSDYTQKVYTKNGDLFLLDLKSFNTLQITQTLSYESNPTFSADDQLIYFNMSNNIYSWDISDGSIRQLSDFKKGRKRESDKQLLGQQQWLKDDILKDFEVLQLKKEQREARTQRRDTLAPERPLEIYYGDQDILSLKIDPNGRYISCLFSENASASKRTKVPDFVTEDGYLNDLNSRPKVGSPQDHYKMGIYHIESDSFYYIDTKQIQGIYDKPEFLKEYIHPDSSYNDQYDKPRKVIIMDPIYNAAADKAVVVIRSQDNKDRWIMSLDLDSAKLKPLDRQRDEAWIGGPGIVSWNFSTGNIGWMNDDKTIWFQSEESGFSHLYTLNTETLEKRALTSGNFEILDVQLSLDKTTFYITANAEGPAEHHFYHLSASGGELKKLTPLEGNNAVSLSPDERYLAIRHSYSNKPWELHVMKNEFGSTPIQITRSTTDEFNAYSWRVPEIIHFKASDGVDVPARLYRAKGGEAGKPAVIFVHGAGYLQNVHKWWSSYFREYMFHNFLADNGYTVLDIDYRASNGYGREWRTAIYRHMGGKDLSDQVDGANYLVEELGVDADNIGIYGGSYGGFISIFAMFQHNDVFKCGAALRSVTDWAHYNHGYTSNILNTPVEDPESYYRSSPIYFADNFNKGKLLMLHGMVDTNVQFQDVVRLSQRLIELGKKNWDVAIFPMEGHGFVYSSSWADEYRRIFELFEDNLK